MTKLLMDLPLDSVLYQLIFTLFSEKEMTPALFPFFFFSILPSLHCQFLVPQSQASCI